MVNYAVRVLFNDDLRATAPVRIQVSGIGVVRELFTMTFKALYPRYVSLWVAGEQALKDYISAMDRLTLKEKRGQRPLNERRKPQIAPLFGTTWSTLNNRAKSGYAPLINVEEVRGDEAQVTLLLHPMEQLALQEFDRTGQRTLIHGREVPTLEPRQFLDIANSEGYRDDEAPWVLKLLAARELIQVDKGTGTIYRIPAGPSPAQVKQQMDALFTAIHGLPVALVSEPEKAGLLSQLEELRERFSPDLDEETLEELALDVGRNEAQYKDLLEQKRRVLDSDLESLVRQMEQRRREIERTPELEGDIGPGLDFRRTLIDMQRELRLERDRLRKEIDQLRQAATEVQRRLATGEITIQEGSQHVTTAQKKWREVDERCTALANCRKGFQDWLKLLRETDELYKTLATLPELRNRLVDDIVHRINQNFARRRFDALAEDAEQFQKECNELITQRETWVAAKREEFNNRKEGLRDWLKQMGVDRADFPARYDHLEHDPSYEEMYSQVIGIARQHLEDLRRQTDEVRLDLRRARQIQWAKLEPEQREILKGLEKGHVQLGKHQEAALETLKALNLIEETGDSLNPLAHQITGMLDDLQLIKTDLQQFLKPVEPKTDSERAVLELLRGQREMDLTDLVLKTEHELAQIMEGLIGLYQGNQVIIKVTRRG